MYFELQLTKQLLWSLVVYIIYETVSKNTQVLELYNKNWAAYVNGLCLFLYLSFSFILAFFLSKQNGL